MGLFLGVSILSIVEIIYFMAFRQLDDETELPEPEESPSHSPSPRRSISNISNATTIASIEIKADEPIVSNSY